MPSIARRLPRLAALVGVVLTVGACSVVEIEDAPLSIFEPAGPNAERLDNLFWMVFWIAAAIFFLVMGALVLVVVRYRDRGEEREPKQVHGNPKLEVIWTVIPALILAAIAVPTVGTVFDLTGCEPDSMRVEVVGHQWWFEFNYPDQGVTTANTLVIPAGEEVCAEMTSEDVIHNFWVPALHGKRYLIPGQTTELRLEASAPGEFWAQCAEFCGLSHSLMRARVVAMSPAGFQAWVAAQQRAAPMPAPDTPEFEGLQVFQSKGCTQCHTVRVEDSSASNILPEDVFNGPDLTHFASRSVFAGATLPALGESREQALKRWLADPPSVKPGSFMPNLALTEQEIDALIAWLESNE